MERTHPLSSSSLPTEPHSADAGTTTMVLNAMSPTALGDLRVEDPATLMYSIRIPETSERIQCKLCRLEFLAAGPTGFLGEESICDSCLLSGCQELGMLLALASVTRTFASFKGVSREEYSEALAELAAFARIYDRITSKFNPSRSFKIPDLEH